MSNEGWIKLHRQMLENPIVTKDADHIAVWIYLLLNATHTDYPALFKGEKITLEPGQLITGCLSIASALKLNESKVRRCLKNFENDGQIGRRTSNQNSLITILNWNNYQTCDGQTDERVTDEWQTSDGRVTDERRTSDDKQECKNIKNEKNVKNEKNNKEKAIALLESLLPEKNISEPLAEKLHEWIIYKCERKEGYQEIGLKSLLSQMEKKEQKYGSSALIECIETCMSRQYKGIIDDLIKPTKQTTTNDYLERWAKA